MTTHTETGMITHIETAPTGTTTLKIYKPSQTYTNDLMNLTRILPNLNICHEGYYGGTRIYIQH